MYHTLPSASIWSLQRPEQFHPHPFGALVPRLTSEVRRGTCLLSDTKGEKLISTSKSPWLVLGVAEIFIETRLILICACSIVFFIYLDNSVAFQKHCTCCCCCWLWFMGPTPLFELFTGPLSFHLANYMQRFGWGCSSGKFNPRLPRQTGVNRTVRLLMVLLQ